MLARMWIGIVQIAVVSPCSQITTTAMTASILNNYSQTIMLYHYKIAQLQNAKFAQWH